MNSVLSSLKIKYLVVVLSGFVCVRLFADASSKRSMLEQALKEDNIELFVKAMEAGDLEDALKENNVELLNKALASKAYADKGSASLVKAMRYKSHDVLKELLNRADVDPNYGNDDGVMNKPFTNAVVLNNEVAINLLLAHPRIDVNRALVNLMGLPWHFIGGAEVEATRIVNIKKLLAHPNANIMKSDKDGKILLDYVIWSLLASVYYDNGYDRCTMCMKMITLLLEEKSMDSLSLQKAHINLVAWLTRTVDMWKDVPDIKKQREVIGSVAAKIKQALDSVAK
jgi:hypothetical protein